MKDYKYQKVYQSIIRDIEEGYLQYHDKIPSVRNMAKSLQVSRTTVENAYDQLLVEGYIYAKDKVGYFVDVQNPIQKQYQEDRQLIQKAAKTKYRYDFTGRYVDDESFNITVWKKYIKQVLASPEELMSYGDTFGECDLKQALQKYSLEHRGVRRPIENYVIGAGFQTLVSYICGLFPKDTMVAMEEGGFKQAEDVFLHSHMIIKKLPIDEYGIDMQALQKSRAQVIYINSSSGGYHGHPLKRQRRNELLQYAREHHVFIIEDDHNGELKFNTKPIDAMARDDNQWVIYVGSFSKLLLPSIRISYMALPTPLLHSYQIHYQDYHQTASKLEQLALAKYIEDGQLARHLKRLRKQYARKGNLMLQRLQQVFPQYQPTLYETALKITMAIPIEKIDSYIELASKYDIFINKNSNHQVALSFSGIIEEDMMQAIDILATIWI